MYDTIIIGSGPAGLSAAVYARRAALSAVVIEKDEYGTGQIGESQRVDNYLGAFGESGFDLGEKFRAHAQALGTEFLTAEVSALVPAEGGYRIGLADGESLTAKTVVYAAGASHRKLGIEGEATFSGKGVSYCAVCDGAFHKGKTVAVIGGGDTALGDALLLSKIAEKVYLVHRRDLFRANKTLQNKVLQTANIQILRSAVPTRILGEKRVEALEIRQAGAVRTLPVSGIFVAVGTIPNSGLLDGLVERSPDGYVIAGEDGITSAPGIFAAGDVRTKGLRQVITAAADGANSIRSVENYLEKNEAVTG